MCSNCPSEDVPERDYVTKASPSRLGSNKVAQERQAIVEVTDDISSQLESLHTNISTLGERLGIVSAQVPEGDEAMDIAYSGSSPLYERLHSQFKLILLATSRIQQIRNKLEV
jgi:hypothetical protein